MTDASTLMNDQPFSDYIVYADESGDHGLSSINPQNPVFVLAFCIFEKAAYRTQAVPAVQSLKFDFWGHDGVVLHSHEIRKSRNDFNILLNEHTRRQFLTRLSSLIEGLPVTIIAAVIDKQRLVQRYAYPQNPYEIALRFCMERLQMWANDIGQADRLMHILVEKRGHQEDASLELEFRRIVDGRSRHGQMWNFDIRFMDKKHNSTGLQIADLVAYPIGRHVIQPDQPNRAFDLLKPKIRSGPQRRFLGYGLKTFP